MDARERDDKIVCAMLSVHGLERMTLRQQREALVRCAYELDGVRELVEAAEIAKRMMDNYGWCRESADAVNTAGVAASRVREAMGNEKEMT